MLTYAREEDMREKIPLKSLSAIDGSVLAVIAQTPDISEEQLKSLLRRASPDAQEIAVKMVELRQKENKEPEAPTSKDRFRFGVAFAQTGKVRKRKAMSAVARDATTRTAQSILHWANMNTKISI